MKIIFKKILQINKLTQKYEEKLDKQKKEYELLLQDKCKEYEDRILKLKKMLEEE